MNNLERDAASARRPAQHYMCFLDFGVRGRQVTLTSLRIFNHEIDMC